MVSMCVDKQLYFLNEMTYPWCCGMMDVLVTGATHVLHAIGFPGPTYP